MKKPLEQSKLKEKKEKEYFVCSGGLERKCRRRFGFFSEVLFGLLSLWYSGFDWSFFGVLRPCGRRSNWLRIRWFLQLHFFCRIGFCTFFMLRYSILNICRTILLYELEFFRTTEDE